jgi:uncharacterized protein DUF748
MNPLRWVRWKVVAVLAVLAGAVYFLGLDKVALSKLNTAGEESERARWSVRDIALGILAGNATLSDVNVATPKGKAKPAGAADAGAAEVKEQVMSAAAAKVDLSVIEVLRKRFVVEEVELQAPKVSMTRRPDGSVNVGDLGGSPPEEAPPEGPPRDWVGTIKKWYDRIQKIKKWVPERGRKPEEREPGVAVDYSRRVTYPFEGRPSFVARKIVGKDLEITFKDEGGSESIPPLKNGRIEVFEVTSSPSVQAEATKFNLSGEIAGAPLKVEGTIDLRGEKSLFSIDAVTGDLPVALVKAFVGASLPVDLKTGTVGLTAKVLLDGADRLEVAPALKLKGITLEAKDPGGKIAGLDAAQFATAFNEASKELEQVEISDLKITGSLASPRFEWGETVKNLVVSGGKAFAKKQVDKGVEKGKEVLEKELEKLPVGKDLKDKVKLDDLKKGIPGIFGGSKEEKPATEKPATEKK